MHKKWVIVQTLQLFIRKINQEIWGTLNPSLTGSLGPTASTHSFTKDDCHTRVPTKSIQRLDWVKKTCAALVSLYIYIYGFPEMGTGKSSILIGFSTMNYASSIFGYPHFRTPTCKNKGAEALLLHNRVSPCFTNF